MRPLACAQGGERRAVRAGSDAGDGNAQRRRTSGGGWRKWRQEETILFDAPCGACAPANGPRQAPLAPGAACLGAARAPARCRRRGEGGRRVTCVLRRSEIGETRAWLPRASHQCCRSPFFVSRLLPGRALPWRHGATTACPSIALCCSREGSTQRCRVLRTERGEGRHSGFVSFFFPPLARTEKPFSLSSPPPADATQAPPAVARRLCSGCYAGRLLAAAFCGGGGSEALLLKQQRSF